jgi:hypothetical protein
MARFAMGERGFEAMRSQRSELVRSVIWGHFRDPLGVAAACHVVPRKGRHQGFSGFDFTISELAH